MLSIKMIKGLFLIIFILIGLIITFTILSFIVDKKIDTFITMLSIFTSLAGSIIALSIPFVMRYIDEKKEEERINKIRWKSFNALDKISHYALKHFDKVENKPKNIEGDLERTKITPYLELLKTYKKENFDLDIIFIEIWKTRQSHSTQCEIYIYVRDSLVIYINTHDFVKVGRIELKLNGEYVKDYAEISDIFNNLKAKLFKI